MSEASINILLTSVGRRVELVRAFRQAYSELDLNGCIVGTDINVLAPGLHIVDHPYIVPPVTSSEYIDSLVDICRKEHIDLVFPLIDPDIPRLSQARALIEATGAKLAVIQSHAVKITDDKWLTYQFFERIKIPTPRTWLARSVPKNVDFPLFVKPRNGSASRGTFKVENRRELDFFTDYVHDPVVQEYFPGEEITNDVLCDLDGNIVSIVSRKRLETRGGEVVKGTTVYHNVITKHCVAIAQQLPAIGPITVQCIAKEDMFYFTEINARFGGGIPLSIAAGVNAPRILLALYAGIAIEIPPLGTYSTGLFVSRFDDALFLDERQLYEMAKRRI